jgi:predicted ferric reductase
MNETLKKYNLVLAPLMFIGLPLLFWALGDVPRRTVLKESISILTILSFFMMLGQFYLARSNGAVKVFKIGKVLKVHKFIGYVFVAVLLFHPFLIVVPRYFEAGVEPIDAFVTMLTTFDSVGILLGMCTWCVMLILGLTSLLRNKISLKYKTWRIFHGILSILFIVLAAWHAIDLGRHTDMAMSIYMIIVVAIGVLLLLKTYLLKTKTTGE